MTSKSAPAPLFVDGIGGGLAVLAAGIARLYGDASAVAATTSPTVGVPAEVVTVLAEIGASAPPVVRLADVKHETGTAIDLGQWALALHPGEGELERLSAARIARDRLEKKLSASS